MSDTLYIVVPCYNEEEVLPEASKRLKEKLLQMVSDNLIGNQSKILFVDDGSKDKTWEIISELHNSDEIFSGIKLTRNQGHQNALLAGLMTAMNLSDVTISIDADLQDDINCLDDFITQYNDGCDIVYGVRSDRRTDSAFKRLSAQGFYAVLRKSGVDVVYNHADCRLMSKRALEGLSSFREANLFLRGIVPLIGYKTGTVEYVRGERLAGESKYPLKKMLSFAWDGISSFSIRPIRLITVLGLLVFVLSFAFLIYAVIRYFTGQFDLWWTMLIVSIWMFGGLQLLALGVIGDYIGRIFTEVKARPKYIIEQILDSADAKKGENI